MAALLVAMTVMSIMLGAALPAWRTYAQREKEAELVFRGEQYARAITLFQRKYANASPPDLDVLVNERFLRKKYKDPITNDDFQIITPGTPLSFDAPGAGTPSPSGATQGGRGFQPGANPPGSPGSNSNAPDEIRQRLNAAAGRIALPGARGGQAGATPGAGLGIIGVTSKSPAKSFRLYRGRDTYNQWVFMGVQQSARAGGAGGAAGQTGRGARGAPEGRGTGRGLQQPPGRGGPQPPPGRGTQPPPTPGRGFGGRNFEN